MIVLIDATTTSLTVSWPSVQGATRYELQFSRPGDDDSFQTLSDHLIGTQARKRNLVDSQSTGFIFRVRAILDKDDESSNSENRQTWVTHSDPFLLLTVEAEQCQMAPPQVFLGGSYLSGRINWKSFNNSATAYELQMRENIGGRSWQTIASNIVGTEVRKKNLTLAEGYQFRVRPLGAKEMPPPPFSPPSDILVALGMSDGVKKLFQGLEEGLLRRDDKVELTDALGGKEFILLYASAHWCGPCRQFTPLLAKWYQSLSSNLSSSEVVFLSCDHDESSFKSYYDTMPWLAVDFDDSTRERLLSYIRVSGIPRLVVIDGRSGSIVEDNAVGQALDVNQWRKLAAKK